MLPKPKRPIKEKFKKEKITISNEENGLVDIIKNYYRARSKTELDFFCGILPPSTNTLYEKSVSFDVRKNKNVIHHSTHPSIITFRNYLHAVARSRRGQFVPHGTVSLILELYSDTWLNKDNTTKKIDSDNMIKPLCDALELSLGFPDELIYYHHTFKVYAPKKGTGVRITLFDCPPIIYQ